MYESSYFSTKSFFDIFCLDHYQEFFRKIVFRPKYINDMFLDSVFDGDYEFHISFVEKCSKKRKKCIFVFCLKGGS